MENTVEMEEPFWINPSGFHDEPDFETYDADPPLDRKHIKESIKAALISVKAALGDAKNVKEYLKKKHPSIDMEYLGDIPLFNFLKFPEAELDSSSSISNIPIAYNCIQRHAVALEQMMEDAKDDSEYYAYLRDKKRYMVAVLSALYELILLLHLRKFRDVTRAAMPDELRNNVPSSLMMRDVIVVKRYTDLIEFLCNILSYCEMIL